MVVCCNVNIAEWGLWGLASLPVEVMDPACPNVAEKSVSVELNIGCFWCQKANGIMFSDF